MATTSNNKTTAGATVTKKKSGAKKNNAEDVRGRVWSDEEFEIFVDIWRSQDIQAKIDGTVRNNAAYGAIAKLMCDMGFERTTKEIKNKIKNVKRDYKKVIDHNRRSGVARKTLPLKEKLDEILGDRPTAAPVAIFQSGHEDPVPDMPDDEEDEGEGTDHDDNEHDEGEFSDHFEQRDVDWGDMDDDVDMTDLSSDMSESVSAESVSAAESTASTSGTATPADPPSRPCSRGSQAAGDDASGAAVTEASQQPLRETNKRPRSGASKDAAGSMKAPRSTKKTRMRETISVVADAFQVHMDRSDHAYREEMRRQRQEEKEWDQRWRQQAAEEQGAFNNTMQTFLATVTGVMTEFMSSRQMAAHQITPYHVSQQPMAPHQMTPQQMTPQQMTPQQMTPQQMAPQQMAPQQMTPQQTAPQQTARQTAARQTVTTHQRAPVHHRPYAGLPRPSASIMPCTTGIVPTSHQSRGPSAAMRVNHPNGDTTILQGDKEYRAL